MCLKLVMSSYTRLFFVLLIIVSTFAKVCAYDFMVGGLCYDKNSDETTVTVTHEIPNDYPRYSRLCAMNALDTCKMYQEAYDTIQSICDLKDHVFVCDSIIDLDRWVHDDDLVGFPREKQLASTYRKRHGYTYRPNLYSACLHQMNAQISDYSHILFFSFIDENILIAQLFQKPSCRRTFNPLDYNSIAFFNYADYFIIVFNDSGELLHISKTEIQFN